MGVRVLYTSLVVKPKERVAGVILVLVLAVVAVWAASAVGATPLLVDQGGRVLSAPQVSAIYLGDYWLSGQGAADAAHLDAFLQMWIDGPSVTDVLAQYRIAPGRFTNSDKVPGAVPAEFTDADAQALVQQEIAARRVVASPQTVHVVYLPPGTVMTVDDTSSLQRLGGYHSSYLDSATGLPVYYLVVAYSQGANGIDFNLAARDNITIVASGVLAGALTNPDAGLAQAGWVDVVNGEVGQIAFALSTDPAGGDVWVRQGAFAVELLWSNEAGKLDAGTATALVGATATGVQTLSITPSNQQAVPGSTVIFTVSNDATSVTALNLTLSQLPAALVGTLGQTALAPGQSTTLTIEVPATTSVGTTASASVTGTSGTSTETATATLSIVATTTGGGQGLSITPATEQVVPGTSASFTVANATSNDTLNLTVSELPATLVATFGQTALAPGQSTTLTIAAGANAAVGTSASITVTGTNATSTQTATATLSIVATSTGGGAGGQGLSITPATQQVVPGTSASFTLANATSTDTLTLSVSELPATLVATFGQTTLAPGQSTTLTIAAAANASVGTSASIAVTGTSATSTQTATATLSIVATLTPGQPGAAPADFTLTVGPTTQTMDVAGEVAVFTLTTTGDPNTTIKLKVKHLRKGLNAYLSKKRMAAGETATLTFIARRDAKRKTYELVLEGKSKHGEVLVPFTLTVR
jgi:hypothetical protein